MDTFQKAFDDEMFRYVRKKVILHSLEKKGYSLTDEQLIQLEEALESTDINPEVDTFTIEVPDTSKDVHLDITLEDDDIEHVLDEYMQKLPTLMPTMMGEMARLLLDALKKQAPEMIAEHASLRTSFEQGVAQRWGSAFALLEMLIVIAIEVGTDFNHSYRPEAAHQNDIVFDVLTRLHARSCQIAQEVLTLLKAGYADGAHARWRTMHEIAVIGYLIKEFGDDIAERYMLHHQIESYRAITMYQQHYTKLGYEPIEPREIAHIQSVYHQLIQRFGRPYGTSYGWAAQALGNRNPTFSDLERAVGLEHWRPHYKLASHNVHANPKGLLFKLGLREEHDLLLSGPSDGGFTDPAHGTAISLQQITSLLMTHRPNLDRTIVLYVLSSLVDEIGDAFLTIQNRQQDG